MAAILPPLIGLVRLVPGSGIATARSRGGMILTRRWHEPGWTGRFSTGPLDRDEHQLLSALLADWVDRNERIDFVHPNYARPISYAGGNWPSEDDASLVSVTHGRQIIVSGLAIGATLKIGDRLTLMQGNLRCYRSIAQDLVVSSNLAQAVPLSPRIPTGLFHAGAAVRFVEPMVRLAVVPDSADVEESDQPSVISFDVEEALA